MQTGAPTQIVHWQGDPLAGGVKLSAPTVAKIITNATSLILCFLIVVFNSDSFPVLASFRSALTQRGWLCRWRPGGFMWWGTLL